MSSWGRTPEPMERSGLVVHACNPSVCLGDRDRNKDRNRKATSALSTHTHTRKQATVGEHQNQADYMWNHWDSAYLWMQWSRDKSVRNIGCPQGGTSQNSLLTLQREQGLTVISSQSRVMRGYTSTEMPQILRIRIGNLESLVGQEPEIWFNLSTVGMLKMSTLPDFW